MHSFKPIKASELKEEVEEFMKEFDENEAIEKVEREKRTREPDEEGFVVVKQRYNSSHNNFYHIYSLYFVVVHFSGQFIFLVLHSDPICII